MAAALSELKQEWRHFRHDKPGERFRNHRDRMKQKSKKHVAVAVALGVLLLVGGVVLLFMPGPGLLLIVFGLALIASHSKRLSNLLDRCEPKLHDKAHRCKSWWHDLTPAQHAAVIVSGLVIAVVLGAAVWKLVIVRYFL